MAEHMTNDELDTRLAILRKHGVTRYDEDKDAGIHVALGPLDPPPARVNIARGEDGVLTHTDMERDAEADKLMYPE